AAKNVRKADGTLSKVLGDLPGFPKLPAEARTQRCDEVRAGAREVRDRLEEAIEQLRKVASAMEGISQWNAMIKVLQEIEEKVRFESELMVILKDRVLEKEKGELYPDWVLTDKSFTALKAAGVPDEVATKLKPLKDKKFPDADKLLTAVKPLLSEEEVKQHLKQIGESAEKVKKQ